jgi:O-antigen/teichoic acid export membrane protein
MSGGDQAPPFAPPSRIATTAVPVALQRLLGQVAEFAGFVVLARALGASDFGIVSAWYLVARYLGLIADWGAYAQGPRDVAAGGDLSAVRRYVRWRTQLSAGGAVAFVAAAWVLQPGVAPLALCLLYRGMNRDWIALGRHQGARAGVPALVQGVAVLAGAVAVLASPSLRAASVAVGVGYALSAVVSIALNRLPASSGAAPASGLPPIRQPWALLILLSDQILITADTVLLALLRSADEAGVYAAVYRFPNAWMTVVALASVGLIPGLTARVQIDPAASLVLRRKILAACAASMVGLAVLAPLSVLLLPALFGSEFDTGTQALVLLFVAAAFNTFAVALAPMVLALNRERRLATFSVALAASSVAVNLWAIPQFGLNGAASVTLAASALSAAYYWVASRG